MKKQYRVAADFDRPENFNDRELSWIAFNDRVIEEAEDVTTPLLERLKFLGIASSNLDEFFMVRVSGVQEQVQAQVRKPNQAGHLPEDHFQLVHQRIHQQVARQYQCLVEQVVPALQGEQIFLRTLKDLTRNQKEFVRRYFDREVFPVLTPLAVDSGHPFPHLRNLSLNLAVRIAAQKDKKKNAPLFALVQVPGVIDRVLKLPPRQDGMNEFILLEELISNEIHLLFPGMGVLEVAAFRLTRDADIDYAEDEADDLLKTVEEELRRRERGSAVRLTVESKASEDLVSLLRRAIGLNPEQVYQVPGPINLAEVTTLINMVDRPDLKVAPFQPSVREPLRSEKTIFRAIARQDILLHQPFESFAPVVDFIEQAAKDPNVLAIKQTLYRTSGDSAIIKALMKAAENGKQVAALMELKARFDEERNISWAKQMEKAGVHVVYGLVGLKTHAKVCLVVRREQGGLRRYVHLSTGNYNPITARIYTDLCLFTCDSDICDDASELFNLLTGYSRMPEWKKLAVAPLRMRTAIQDLIDGETARARAGGKGRIRAKMNSLVDQTIITKLYEASCAGVQIDLIVRGICCLKPGVKGVSENIRVSSIIDRFLEHSRIFLFGEGETERLFLASADWMPRNLDRRIEALFPIEAPELRRRIVDEILGLCFADNVKRRVLGPDGVYRRIERGRDEEPVRSQVALLEIEDGLRRDSQSLIDTRELLAIAEDEEEDEDIPLSPIKPVARGLKFPASKEELPLYAGATPIPNVKSEPAAAPTPPLAKPEAAPLAGLKSQVSKLLKKK